MKRPVWTSLEAITVNQAGGSGVGLSDVAIKNTKCPLKFEFQANFFLVQACPMQYLGNSNLIGRPVFYLAILRWKV